MWDVIAHNWQKCFKWITITVWKISDFSLHNCHGFDKWFLYAWGLIAGILANRKQFKLQNIPLFSLFLVNVNYFYLSIVISSENNNKEKGKKLFHFTDATSVLREPHEAEWKKAHQTYMLGFWHYCPHITPQEL